MMNIKNVLNTVTFIVGMMLFCPFALASAQNVTFTTTVANVSPSSDSVLIDGGASEINLSEGTTTDVTITATISDNNGCEDIEAVVFNFYRTDVDGGASCIPNSKNCYSATGTAVTSGNTCDAVSPSDPDATVDLSVDYEVTVPFWYYADATDIGEFADTTWTATAMAYDGNGSGDASLVDTIEVSTLLAIDVTPSIAFGTMILGSTSADDSSYDTSITNTGNKSLIDLQVKSNSTTAMVCELGNISVSRYRSKNVW